ncbi:MAG: succinate--CoA ligase subunit alpha [Desulfotomaculales bacterium]
MAILIDERTRVIVQGITGAYGRSQTAAMKDYGTRIVAGISPGKYGLDVFGIPVYNTIAQAKQDHEFDAAIVYVPPRFTREAVLEAIENDLRLVVIATEGVPVHDTMYLRRVAEKRGVWIVGPNSIGMISPGKCLLGSLAPSFALPGKVGLISRSGTMSIEFVQLLGSYGIGISTAVGIGGDAVIGKNPVEYLRLFEADPETEAVVLLGEIGGAKEMEAAEFIRTMQKKVFCFIAGASAPPGKRMGHIGAIAFSEDEGAESKRRVLTSAGAYVAQTPWELAERLKEAL